MWRKKSVLFVLGLYLLLMACGKSGGKDVRNGAAKWQVNVCLMEDGVLYKNSDTGCMEFFDYETGSYRALCADPNCLHDSMECEAVYLYEKANFIGRLGDKWYYNGLDAKEKRSFRCCDLDGGNDKKVGEFPYDFSGAFGDCVLFYEGSCILATDDTIIKEETEEWIGTISGIYRYHFDTGGIEMICQEKEYMRPAYAVYGTYKDWLIYTEYNGEYVTLKSKNLKTARINGI